MLAKNIPHTVWMSDAIANAARLLAEPARAAMLLKLMGGRAVPAGELALAAHISPQTASEHLAQLSEAGFVAAQRRGRHRYYELANDKSRTPWNRCWCCLLRPAQSLAPGQLAPHLEACNMRADAIRILRDGWGWRSQMRCSVRAI